MYAIYSEDRFNSILEVICVELGYFWGAKKVLFQYDHS
jgi:hypothetical protein